MELRLIIEMLLRRKTLILRVFSAIFLTIFFGTLLVTPRYDTAAKVILRKSAVESTVISGFGAVASSSGTTISETEKSNYLEISTLRPLLEDLIVELDIKRERLRGKIMRWLPFLKPVLRLVGVDEKSAYKEITAEELVNPSITSIIFPQPNVEVAEVEDTDVLEVTAISPDPEQAMLIANTLARILRDYEIEKNRAEYKKYREFLDSNMERIRSRYYASAKEIMDFKKKEKTLNIEEKADTIEAKVTELRTGLEENQIDLRKTLASMKHMEEKLKDIPEFRKSSETIKSNDQIASIKGDLHDFYLDLAQKKLNYTDKHPSIIELNKKIEEAQALMKKEIDKVFSSETVTVDPIYSDFLDKLASGYLNIAILEIQNEIIPELLEKYEKKLLEMPQKIFDFTQISLDESMDAEIYKSLYNLRYKLDLAEVLSVSNVYVLESAVTPKKDDGRHRSPSLLINTIIAIFLGVTFSVGSALVAEYMDDTIRSRRDLASFDQLTFLGYIQNLKKPAEGGHEALPELPSSLKEEFRSIRNKLMFLSPGNKPRSLAVVSAGLGEGKSFVAANLAISLAEANMNVLLLDADLKKPALHEQFNVQNKAGLTDYLNGTTDLKDVAIDTGRTGLKLITAGTSPADPAKFIESDKMRKAIKDMEESYDFVVIDTPSISESSDAPVLSAIAGGAMPVLDYGRTTRIQLLEMIETLGMARANVLGVVLNRVVKPGLGISLSRFINRLRKKA